MRSICEKHNNITSKLRNNLETIQKESEGRPAWAREQRAEAIDKAKAESRSLAVELKVEVAGKQNAARDVFNETRKGQSTKTPTASERLLYQQHAAMMFAGKTPEQSIQLYEYSLSKLTPAEKQSWRHVYDDALELACYGDPAIEFQAAQTIAKYRTPDEKSALRAVQKADRMGDFTETITAVMETNIQEAIDGETQANNPAEVFDIIERDVAAELASV